MIDLTIFFASKTGHVSSETGYVSSELRLCIFGPKGAIQIRYLLLLLLYPYLLLLLLLLRSDATDRVREARNIHGFGESASQIVNESYVMKVVVMEAI